MAEQVPCTPPPPPQSLQSPVARVWNQGYRREALGVSGVGGRVQGFGFRLRA